MLTQISTTDKSINMTKELFTKVLVLFHTAGCYEDDWEPMTPIGKTSNFKWNGQRCHRDDHLMQEHGTDALIVYRDKKTEPFKFYGKAAGGILLHGGEEVERGVPRRFSINNVSQTSFNGIAPGTILSRCEEFMGSGCMMKSALYHLGLQRIEGNHIGGIQLCRKV